MRVMSDENDLHRSVTGLIKAVHNGQVLLSIFWFEKIMYLLYKLCNFYRTVILCASCIVSFGYRLLLLV